VNLKPETDKSNIQSLGLSLGDYMSFDFKPYFERYEKLVTMSDEVFTSIKDKFPENVKCKTQCDDCCHALFDLTLIEALYINNKFSSNFAGEEKEGLLEKANIADRQVYKLKREAFKAHKEGKGEAEILLTIAKERIRCPLLNGKKMCELYDYRPITCRLYGIPTAIGGKGHTCGLSGFTEGKPYPTVNIDKIQQKLYELSAELVRDMKTEHVQMAEIIVPLSMALITEYTEQYLGIAKPDSAGDSENKGAGNDG
jgi:Fe-S-cluster containining protein